MHFDLSPEQQLLEQTVRSFALTKLPVTDTLPAAESGDHRFAAAWRGLAELGLAGVLVPEDRAGLGLEVLDAAVAAQALGYGAAPVSFLGQWLTSLALLRAGSEAQRAQWLPGIADGSVRAAVVWDDGRPVPGARTADVLLVRKGAALALARPDDVEVRPLAGADLLRPVDAVEAGEGVGEALPGADAAVVERLLAAGRTLVAADSYGAAQRALDTTVSYVCTRRQFGRPVGQFQAVKHQLADLATAVAPAQGLYWYAAHAVDTDLADLVDAAATAKAHIGDVAVRAVRTAIELHGGFGYTWECELHVYLRRVLLNRELLGDPASLRRLLADRRFGA